MKSSMKRSTQEIQGAKDVKCAIVQHDLLRQMTGNKSYGWFIDQLITREWKRRQKRMLIPPLPR
jgi:hypothetical protein